MSDCLLRSWISAPCQPEGPVSGQPPYRVAELRLPKLALGSLFQAPGVVEETICCQVSAQPGAAINAKLHFSQACCLEFCQIVIISCAAIKAAVLFGVTNSAIFCIIPCVTEVVPLPY